MLLVPAPASLCIEKKKVRDTKKRGPKDDGAEKKKQQVETVTIGQDRG